MFFLHFGLPKVSVFSEHIILVCSTMYIRICTSKTVILKNALDGECVKELVYGQFFFLLLIRCIVFLWLTQYFSKSAKSF